MTGDQQGRPINPAQAFVALRPLASPLPLGFLALGVATTAFASLQLGWIATTEGHTIALAVLVLAVPLQLLAAIMGFLVRSPVAATSMGILSGTWAGLCLSTLTSPPGATSSGIGVILLCSSVCLLVPAVAARTKAVPAAVILLSAARFAVTGIAEATGDRGWLHAAGWVGVALTALSAYAALALELEGSERRTVLPVGRSAASRRALDGRLSDQVRSVATEPGVRREL